MPMNAGSYRHYKGLPLLLIHTLAVIELVGLTRKVVLYKGILPFKGALVKLPTQMQITLAIIKWQTIVPACSYRHLSRE